MKRYRLALYPSTLPTSSQNAHDITWLCVCVFPSILRFLWCSFCMELKQAISSSPPPPQKNSYTFII
jgi:hypothetical protein